MKQFLWFFLPALVIVFSGRTAAQGTYSTPYSFSTVAGLVTAGSTDGPASLARFNEPYGIAVDAGGNIYVADTENNSIRKISAAGIVSTLAGQVSTSPFVESVDDVGSSARFGSPQAVAVDASGTLYAADLLNNTIRKVTSDGVVTTFAGTAHVSGSVDGEGSAARFNRPTGVAVDKDGNVYVADEGDHTIRKITPAGVVSTLAGQAGSSGSADGIGSAARFNAPKGVAVDAAGMVYVSDRSNSTIRKITPAGLVSTLAGQAGKYGSDDGGTGVAKLGSPSGLAVDSAGNVYVTDDGGQNTIRKISAAGVVSTLAGQYGISGSRDGAGATAQFFNPRGVAVDASGVVYVADSQSNRIRRITPGGVVSTVAGPPGAAAGVDGVGSAARFSSPWAIAVDQAGTVYVGDTDNYTIRKISPAGVVTTLAGMAGEFDLGLTSDGVGSAARFGNVYGIAVDASGNVYAAESSRSRIRKISPNGIVTTFAGGPYLAGTPEGADGVGLTARFNAPEGVAIDQAGNVFVSDTWNHTIRKVTPAGVVTTVAGKVGVSGSVDGTGAAARFSLPKGLAVDSAGNIYVADSNNGTIRKISPAGVVVTIAGQPGYEGLGNTDGLGTAARFDGPNAVAIDAAGNLYVADSINSTLRRIAPDGMVTTIAGKSTVFDPLTRRDAFGTADGIGSAVGFNRPRGLAVDAMGHVYVADTYNELIRYGVVAPQVAPAFSSHPSNQTIPLAGNASFTIVASGFPAVGLRWQVSTDGGVNFTDIADGGSYAGATAATLTITGVTAAMNGNRYRCVATNAVLPNATSNAVTLTVNLPPSVASQPISQTAVAGGSTSLTVAVSGNQTATYQWQLNGSSLSGATSATLPLNNVQPSNAGLYTATLANSGATTITDAAIVGVSTTSKVIGAGTELQPANIPHPNGNTFDQVLLTGTAETITADVNEVTRTSFIDLNNDIVQVEFTGAGTLSLVLDNPTGPATPVNYNQASVSYMKGHAGIVVTGANETTNLSVFSVGRINAFDPTGTYNILLSPSATNVPANNGSSLFAGHASTSYDGVADVAFIAISTTNGKFGGLRASNASFFATKGFTGIYAPGVQFIGPVFVSDIDASASATPVFIIGSSPDTRITGGNLLQTNSQPVKVAGLIQLKFTAGATSHNAQLSAQTNKAILQQNGIDVTAQTVVNP